MTTYRKKKPRNGQILLLNTLWKKLGGPYAVALKLGVSRHAPNNWYRDGAVPAKFMLLVSQTFGIPIWGLNFKVAKFLQHKDKAPTWKKVVEMYDFNNVELEKEIIELGEPK